MCVCKCLLANVHISVHVLFWVQHSFVIGTHAPDGFMN